MTPKLDAALLCSSRAGSDLGCKSDGLRSLVNWFSHSQVELVIVRLLQSLLFATSKACIDRVRLNNQAN